MSARAADRVIPAILISLLAILLFDCMALVIKYLSPRYGAAELSAYRNLFGLIPAAIALWSTPSWHQSGRPRTFRQWPLAVIRGVAVSIAQLCFYLALARMAFATATTISYSNALFVLAYSVPLLGERVGLFRWSAALIGFAGVILVMSPGPDGINPDAILPLIAAALYAVAGVTSRMLDPEVPSGLVNMQSSAVSALGALILALALGGFSPIASWADLGWILAMGLFGGTAVFCLVVSYRMTEPANLAPFSYFGIPTAFALGWLFFGEAPVDDLFPGAILIVAGGLMIIWRERSLAKRAAATGRR